MSASGRIEAEATVVWQGWGGEVRGASGVLSAPTATQVELGGPGEGTNPEELLAAALANCFTSTLTALARARDVDLAGVETHARTHLLWDEKHPHHIAKGSLSVTIRASGEHGLLVELAQEAREHCPVCNLLAAATAEVPLLVVVKPLQAAAPA